MATAAPLTADSWIEAALAALLEEGPDAVAVQPLARRIGTTKGSFYWHFGGRDELLESALDRWYETNTEQLIAGIEAVSDDAATKARLLLRRVTSSSSENPGELQLMVAVDQPLIAAAVSRVTRRRIDYVASLLRADGQPRAVAARRALLSYATYLGHAQLAFSAPDALPASKAGRRALLDEMTAILLG
jgi:AcrR family transcriptional regulator